MPYLKLLLVFIASIILSIFFLDRFIEYSKKNNLLDIPDDRKKHINPTPSSGGLIFGILLTFLVPSVLVLTNYLTLILCALILLIVGYCDDRYDLSVKIKFSIQIIMAVITLSLIGPIELIENAPFYFNYIFTFFFIIGFINSYNLIDGVNGLAGLYALLVFSVLSSVFLLINDLVGTFITITLMAGLIGFLKFNMRSAKIFMGDTGSLFLGYLISVLTIIAINRYIESSNLFVDNYSIHLIFLATLLLPMFDTIRIMFVRFMKGTPLFKADRIHLHHLLGKTGLKPLGISISFTSISIFLIAITALLIYLNLNFLIILVSIISITTIIFNIILYIRVLNHKRNIKHYQDSLKYIIENNHLINGNALNVEIK